MKSTCNLWYEGRSTVHEKYLAHPKHFYCLCVFDALPYHLRSLTSPIEVYLVPTANIYSAVDSAVAIWQAVSGSAGK